MPRKDDGDPAEVLAALTLQTVHEHEVVLLDAVDARARAAAARRARAGVVAFLGGRAVPEPRWLEALLEALADADVAFGRQVHAPRRVGAAVVCRGLRYDVFAREPPLPALAYASRSNAAWRREALVRLDAGASATDAGLARRAHDLGSRLVYAPRAVVRHREAPGSLDEWTRVRAEGRSHGGLARTAGVDGSLLLWGGVVAGATAGLLLGPGLAPAALAAGALWAPTARRLVVLRPARYPLRALVAGVAVAPAFDLAYLSAYVGGLARP